MDESFANLATPRARRAKTSLASSGMDLEWVLKGGVSDAHSRLAAPRDPHWLKTWLRLWLSWRRVYEIVFAAILLWQWIEIPFTIGFVTYPPLSLLVFSVLADALFVFHLCWNALLRWIPRLRLGVGRERARARLLALALTDPEADAEDRVDDEQWMERARRAYLTSFAFVSDALAALPFATCLLIFVLAVPVTSAPSGADFVVYQLLLWLRVVRLVQLTRVYAFYRELRRSKFIPSTVLSFVALALVWVVFVHWFACLFYALGRYEINANPDSPTWLTENDVGHASTNSSGGLADQPVATQYFVSFYVTALTLFGQPPSLVTLAEVLFNLLVLITGAIVLMSLVLALFVNLISVLSARSNTLQDSIDRVKSLCTELNVSAALTSRLTAEWARLGKSSLSLDLTVNTHRDLLVPLPYDVKALFVCEVIRGLITSANMNVATNRAWFALMSMLMEKHMRFLVELVMLMDFVHGFHGDLLAVRNAPADSFFILQDGALEVLDAADDATVLVHLHRGSVVGIAAFAHERAIRSNAVRFLGQCRLWRVERSDFEKLEPIFTQEVGLFSDFFSLVHDVQESENAARAAARPPSPPSTPREHRPVSPPASPRNPRPPASPPSVPLRVGSDVPMATLGASGDESDSVDAPKPGNGSPHGSMKLSLGPLLL